MNFTNDELNTLLGAILKDKADIMSRPQTDYLIKRNEILSKIEDKVFEEMDKRAE